MVSYTRCPRCGATYESSKLHVCSVGGKEDLGKAYYGSEDRLHETEGGTGER